jgi:hypothetical protein
LLNDQLRVLLPAMPAFWSGSGLDMLSETAASIALRLAGQQIRHFRTTELEQSPAWEDSIAAVQRAVSVIPQAAGWRVLLEYPIIRLGRRIDAVLVTPHAVLVLEFKREQADIASRAQVEDYALDLFDFHELSRRQPVVPILVSGGVRRTSAMPLVMHGVTTVLQTSEDGLADLLRNVVARCAIMGPPLDPATWEAGAYRPVPTIVEAACMAYSRNGVADIREARADRRNLHATTSAIARAIAHAQDTTCKTILFVTGIPGAGKTLCGLDAAFANTATQRGTFLTGNPSLVHVLREALVRDAVANGAHRGDAERKMSAKIQRLPDFRTHYLAHPTETPDEPVVVIDEAQRCWSRDHAIRKTRDKPLPLTDSEPGHLLDIMARRSDFAVLVCMIGGGQEIHDGDGAKTLAWIAEWGAALRARPEWQVLAAPDAADISDPRQRLGAIAGLIVDGHLHLDVSIRQIRGGSAASWVDAVLRGDAADAADIARSASGIPFMVTRDLTAMRTALRQRTRGTRRSGLLASAGARRLRAEGLGAELAHMDAGAVARWFLDHYPSDVRASDALEQVATEFSCQGLELDSVGHCWDGDLVRNPRGTAWVARSFRGTDWQTMRAPEKIANQLNTYRVLLTRARDENNRPARRSRGPHAPPR